MDSDWLSKLPEEIITLILSKLPAKSLVELIRVSKLFKFIISQPYFLDLHLSTLPNQEQQHHLSISYIQPFEYKFFLFHHDDSGRISRSYIWDQSSVLSTAHNDSGSVYFVVVGSTRGLICLCNKYDAFCLRLWNPSIGKVKRLPPLPDYPEFHRATIYQRDIVFGFAYDDASADFKLVVICYETTQGCSGGIPVLICVYSEKRKSWRDHIKRMELPYYARDMYRPDVLFDQTIHYWFAHKEKRYNYKDICIMGFDIVNEVCNVLELPRDISMQLPSSYDTRCLRLFSMVDEQSLGLFASMEGFTESSRFINNWGIWVMNTAWCSSNPNKSSWEKRYNLVLGDPFRLLGVVNDRHICAWVYGDYNGSYGLIDVEDKDTQGRNKMHIHINPDLSGSILIHISRFVPSLALFDA